MNINRFNINHVIIKNDNFNIDNVKCNINNKTIHRTFILLEYETQYINLDGLYLETPKLSIFNNCVLVNNCKNKYNFNIPLLDNDTFNNIFLNIDKKIKNIVKNVNSVYDYDNSIKEDIITINKHDYEYKYITTKLNSNECHITLDNKIYNGDLDILDYSKIQMKFILSSCGLCKIDNKFSLSWKILKLDMKTIVLDLNNYKNILFKKISRKIKNNETLINNETSINNETLIKKNFLNNIIDVDINNTEDLNDIDDERIYIPNFELELENIEF